MSSTRDPEFLRGRGPRGGRGPAVALAVVVISCVLFAVIAALALLPRPPGPGTLPTVADTPSPTPSATPTAPVSSRADLEGQQVALEAPAGAVAGLALLFPDLGQSVDDALASPVAQQLRAAGWATAAAQQTGDGWASPDSTTRVSAFVQWAEQTAGSAPYVFVSTGLGAATSLAAMVRTAQAPPCWVALSPAVDLGSAAAADPAIEAAILAAWGGQTPDPTQDPLVLAASLPAGMGIEIVRGASVVGGRDDTDALAGALQAAGREVLVADTADGVAAFAEGCRA